MKYFLILGLYIIVLLLLSNANGKENNNDQIELLLKEVIQLNQNVQELVQQYKKPMKNNKK